MAEETTEVLEKGELPFDDVDEKVDEGEQGGEEGGKTPVQEVQDAAELVSRLSDDATERSAEEVEADILQIEALAQSYPQIREMDEYKNLVSIAEKMKEEEEGEEGGAKGEKKDEGEEEGEEGDNKDEKEEGEDDEKDVFGITKKKEPKKKIGLKEVPKELTNFIEKNYSIKDVDTFFSSVDKWRNDSQRFSEISSEHNDILAGLEELPQPIKNAIEAYANAEDYYEAFTESGERLNYNLPFEKQSRESIVQHYFTDKVKKLNEKLDDDEIDEEQYDERIDDLYDAARTVYNTDRTNFNKQRVSLLEEAEKERKVLRKSADDSVENLRKKFPDFSAKDLQRVKQRLVDEDVMAVFYDKNGAYKDNAAEMLALALFGSSVIEKLTEKAKREGESKANEKIVRRGKKDVGSVRKSSRASDKTKAHDAISHLSPSFNPDPYA